MSVAKMSAPLEFMTASFIDLAERGLIPDPLLRTGIRKLCADRLKELRGPTLDAERARLQTYVEELKRAPIAVHTKEANEQHYEVPSGFFKLVLGKNLKYSSAFFPDADADLDRAEDSALATTIERAEIRDGMRILELGCGWGSLTLAMARRFPNSRITALSNSSSQREFILSKAASEGLKNVEVLTRNIVDENSLPADEFDRLVSVEMFEHLKNYEALFERISVWLKKDAKMFVHIFTHREFPYPFETDGEDNWMGRYFFTGGQMPSHDLLLFFQDRLRIEKQWAWDGTHYARTADAWLANQDRNRDEVMKVLSQTYGEQEAARWFHRWRMFFMACSELFGFEKGNQWGVSHYLFRNVKK